MCHFRGPSLPVPFIVLPQAWAVLDGLAGLFSYTHFYSGRVRNSPGTNSILASACFLLILTGSAYIPGLSYTSHIPPQVSKVTNSV